MPEISTGHQLQTNGEMISMYGDSILITDQHPEVMKTAALMMLTQMTAEGVPDDHVITLMWRAESPEEFEARVRAAQR